MDERLQTFAVASVTHFPRVSEPANCVLDNRLLVQSRVTQKSLLLSQPRWQKG